MQTLLISLILLPFVFGFLTIFSARFYKPLAWIFVLSLISLSSLAFIDAGTYSVSLPHQIHLLFQVVDVILILYFLYQGIKFKSTLVRLFALTQLILFSCLLYVLPSANEFDIVVDNLSLFMFMLINIVGGMIVIYALGYLDYEDFSEQKKRNFIAILIAFLGVMNFIVVANNLEWFFLAFEITTLASYLLIRYRFDAISIENSLRALWMNQVGGVALLIGMLILISKEVPIYFNTILEYKEISFLAFAIIAVAGLVKGAQLPFDKWLLGAMVAPTPVSAILHSSTMVKIAPFLILKLSPLLIGTLTGNIIAIFGGYILVSASLSALNEENFKKILAYSTIALLGLMIALGGIGTNLAIAASLLLIWFHGISKAMLFLQAGNLEKLYHKKEIESLNGLLNTAPITTLFIIVGFASLTLPPFGGFLAKWLALEGVSQILLLIAMSLGGVLLVVLYFKVSARVLIKENEGFIREKIPFNMLFPNVVLSLILVVSAIFLAPILSDIISPIAMQISNTQSLITSKNLSFSIGFSEIPFWLILTSLILMILIPLLSLLHFKNIDRTKVYNCGERVEINLASYYFAMPLKWFALIGGIFYIIVIVSGVVK